MNRGILRALPALVVALALLLPSPAVAQRGVPSGEELSRQEMVQRLQRQYEDYLARELQLTPEQRERFEEVLTSFRQHRAELLPRRIELMREMRETRPGARSDERSQQLIREMRELREREARLLTQEEDRLLEILTPSQVLTLQLLRDQFEEAIRSFTAGGPPGTPGARGPGPPGPPGTPRR